MLQRCSIKRRFVLLQMTLGMLSMWFRKSDCRPARRFFSRLGARTSGLVSILAFGFCHETFGLGRKDPGVVISPTYPAATNGSRTKKMCGVLGAARGERCAVGLAIGWSQKDLVDLVTGSLWWSKVKNENRYNSILFVSDNQPNQTSPLPLCSHAVCGLNANFSKFSNYRQGCSNPTAAIPAVSAT